MIVPAMLLIGTSIALYTIEYLWKVEYLAGITAASLLTVGLACADWRSPKLLVVAVSLFPGLMLAWLCRTAKRARLNKIHDL